ncbi:MAG: hypothetical protein BWX45_01156 [Deltaproteobacteria bacterium ADurb.Bin002]|nr:MAG: hypothetical protein BWX45_01156 [Deltaproteobacteria bacterium ADurb.Bin002]
MIVDRNADLFELGPCQKHGIDFIVRFIDDIERDGVGVKQIQDAVLQIDQDLGNILRGMNAVGDVLKFFL